MEYWNMEYIPKVSLVWKFMQKCAKCKKRILNLYPSIIWLLVSAKFSKNLFNFIYVKFKILLTKFKKIIYSIFGY